MLNSFLIFFFKISKLFLKKKFKKIKKRQMVSKFSYSTVSSFLKNTKKFFFKSIKKMFFFKKKKTTRYRNILKKVRKMRFFFFNFNLKSLRYRSKIKRRYRFFDQIFIFKKKFVGMCNSALRTVLGGFKNDKFFFKKVKNVNNLFLYKKFSVRSLLTYYFKFLKGNSVLLSNKELNGYLINNVFYKNLNDFDMFVGDTIKMIFSRNMLRFFLKLNIRKIKKISKIRVKRLKAKRIKRFLFFKDNVKSFFFFRKKIKNIIFRKSWYNSLNYVLKSSTLKISDKVRYSISKIIKNRFSVIKKKIIYKIFKKDLTGFKKRRKLLTKNKQFKLKYYDKKKRREGRLYKRKLNRHGYYSKAGVEFNGLNFSFTRIFRVNFFKKNQIIHKSINVLSWRLYEWDRK